MSPESKEVVRARETDDFFARANVLYDHLTSSELPPYRILASHNVADFENPLHMPEAINRFREVGVPISDIHVALDITKESAQWSITVDLASLDNSFRKSFTITDTNGIGEYTISDTDGNSAAVSHDELSRILIDLSISRHERQQNLIDDRPIQLDATSPVSARLIHLCLQNRPGVESSVTAYYDISQHITTPEDIEFIVEKTNSVDIFRIEVEESSQDGYVEHIAHYGAALKVKRDMQTGSPSYTLSAEGTRLIDIGDGTIAHDDPPQEDAIIPYAIVHLANLCYLFGADLPKTVLASPEEIRYNEQAPSS